jgi:hypothetical protein
LIFFRSPQSPPFPGKSNRFAYPLSRLVPPSAAGPGPSHLVPELRLGTHRRETLFRSRSDGMRLSDRLRRRETEFPRGAVPIGSLGPRKRRYTFDAVSPARSGRSKGVAIGLETDDVFFDVIFSMAIIV